MAVDADEAYMRGLDFFTTAVGTVPPDGWDGDTPCAGWRPIDLLGHVGQATRFGTALLRAEAPGRDPVEVPGDAVQGDPVTWWSALADAARAAVPGADLDRVVDSPRGPRSIREGFSFPAVDLFVHGWDLTRSAGRDVQIPEDMIAFAYALAEPMPEEVLRGPGVFGPQVIPPTEATPTQRLVAWMGRDPLWRPAAGGA